MLDLDKVEIGQSIWYANARSPVEEHLIFLDGYWWRRYVYGKEAFTPKEYKLVDVRETYSRAEDKHTSVFEYEYNEYAETMKSESYSERYFNTKEECEAWIAEQEKKEPYYSPNEEDLEGEYVTSINKMSPEDFKLACSPEDAEALEEIWLRNEFGETT